MITSIGSAKEKWCPFDRGQASPREHGAGTCLGPGCMMWRFWVPPPGVSCNEAGSWSATDKHGKPDNEKKGYCGLSGSY
jgi:hypothetical protein